MEADEVGAGIIAHSRQARFADISTDEWEKRLTNLISAQADVIGKPRISNVRQVGEAAGGSNGTLLFDASYDTDKGPVLHNLVLRFLPASGLFHKYDLEGQFSLQKALESTDVPVPSQIWLDAVGDHLVQPGYVMSQVPGASTPMVWKASGLMAEAAVGDRRKMTIELVHALAKIHNVDWRAAGLAWLEDRAKGIRPIEREVNWYWEALVWSEDEEYQAMLKPVQNWLIANEPEDIELVLCHGDSNFGNYMFDHNKITAVIDWEMSFLGTPECDLSFLVAGDDVIGAEIPWLEGALSFEEMFDEYERVSGHKLRHMDYFLLFSAYRVAVINVLAMKHFPPDALVAFMPTLERGPKLCVARAKALGAVGTLLDNPPR